MKKLINSLIKWISEDPQYREIEAYLSQSTDMNDLERRIKKIERIGGRL